MKNKKRSRVLSDTKKQSTTSVDDSIKPSEAQEYAFVAPPADTLSHIKPSENKTYEHRYSVECKRKKKCKRKPLSGKDDGTCSAISADQCSLPTVMKPNVKLKPVAKSVETAKKCLKSGYSSGISKSASLSVVSSGVCEALSVDSTVPSKRRKRKRHRAEVDPTVKLKKSRTVDDTSDVVSAVIDKCSVVPNKCNFNIVQLRSALQHCGKFSDAVSRQSRLCDKASLKTATASTKREDFDADIFETSNKSVSSEIVPVDSSSGLLKERMMNRLAAARFRFINEQMYRSTGNEAAEMFAHDKDAFAVYHAGFQSQVSKWPTNPVDRMIDYINNR